MPKDEDAADRRGDRAPSGCGSIRARARRRPRAPAPPPWEAPLALARPAVPAARLAGLGRAARSLRRGVSRRAQGGRADAVADALFARRVYLDVWGLLPAPEELQAFLADTSPDKREALVARLLADDQKYAEHWISFWNDLLRNEDGVTYFSETAGRKSITDWLLASLAANLPYDQFVTKLLNPAAPGDPEGFLVGVNWRGETSAAVTPWMQASQNTAQVFLGDQPQVQRVPRQLRQQVEAEGRVRARGVLLAGAQAADVSLRRGARRVRRAGVPVSRAGARAGVELARRSPRGRRGRSSPIRAMAGCRARSSTASGTGSSATASSRTRTRWTASRGARSCSTGSPAISSSTATTSSG